MYDIKESYRDTIIGHFGNSGTADLLLHIVKCWRACAVNEENLTIPMFLYCYGMMYKYYSCLWFFPIKHNEEGKYIHSEIFNSIIHFIKNRLHVYCIQDSFLCTRIK